MKIIKQVSILLNILQIILLILLIKNLIEELRSWKIKDERWRIIIKKAFNRTLG